METGRAWSLGSYLEGYVVGRAWMKKVAVDIQEEMAKHTWIHG